MSEEAERKIAEYFRGQIKARVEQHMMDVLLGRSSTTGTANIQPAAAVPVEPLTYDKLRRMEMDFKREFPTQTFLQSIWFPAGNAIRIEGPGEIFLCAGEVFWRRLDVEMRRQAKPHERDPSINPLFTFNYQPTNIDPEPGDDVEDAQGNSRAKWKRQIWDRFKDAMLTAMVELPDWLKARDRDADKEKRT